MKLNRRQFLAGLLSVGATIAMPVALAEATPAQVNTAWKQLLKNPWYFDVNECDTIVDSSIGEPKIRSDVFDIDLTDYCTPESLVSDIESCWPLTSRFQQLAQNELEEVRSSLEDDDSLSFRERRRLRKLAKALEDENNGWSAWVLLEGTVTGLVTHPIVLFDGTIVSQEGLHKPSGLLLHGSVLAGAKAYSQAEAVKALGRLHANFLEGFEFETPLDAMVALSALLTGVVRRVLDLAPGYVFLAPIQSSGKTTLARRIHVILTGRDMPVSNFAADDEQEMQKRILSMLMTSPAMVCLDNVTDGTTFSSSAISMVMTSPVFKQRVLGVSKDAECPTNVLFVATGNNLSLGADELTRWLPAYLNPRTARPQERLFQHPDVVAHALRMRSDLLRDVVGVIAGYLNSKASMPTGCRFSRWDHMVRQPIIWAGGEDIAEVFRANTDNSETNGAAVALLTSLQTIFGTSEFSAGEIAGRASSAAHDDKFSAIYTMMEALTAMHCRDPRSDGSVGRALRSIVNRRVPTALGDLTLKRRLLNGLARYSIG